MTNVAIVTGGSRGIGRATALKLGAQGYTVVVNYASNEAAANEVVNAITAKGGKAVAIKGDVAQEADVLALFAAADKLGTLKVLINNAGVMDRQNRLDEMSLERLKRLFDINILGSFLCAREAVKRMSTKHGGTGGVIVNQSSAAAVLGRPASASNMPPPRAPWTCSPSGLAARWPPRASASTPCAPASSTPRSMIPPASPAA